LRGKKEFVASLIEATRALSNVIGAGSMAKVEFEKYKNL